MTIHDMMHWRYATQKFDTSKPLATETLDYILEAGNLAATSYGLQPFQIVVVTDEATKQALKPVCFNQPKVGENGALLVLCGRTDVDTSYIDEYLARVQKTRDIDAEDLTGFRNMMINDLTNRSEEGRLTWALKQSYIVLGTMMVAAAEQGVDGGPMEGFLPDKVAEVLDLASYNLYPASMLALGYRAEDDETQHLKKVRRPLEDTVIRM